MADVKVFNRRVIDELNDDLEVLAGNRKPGKPSSNGGVPRLSARTSTSLSEEVVLEENEDMSEDALVEAATSSANGVNGDSQAARAAHAAAHVKAMRKHHKRAGRAQSISEDGRFGMGTTMGGGGAPANGCPFKEFNKNSRKSRTGFGRGLPKKGGAGGKGTWGKLGDELELPWVDPNDPNYDSENDEDSLNGSVGGGNRSRKSSTTKLQPLVPEMSEEDVRKTVEPLILEYFENNDANEVLFTLQEMLMNLGGLRWMIVSLTVELAMDHKPSHREMSSVLFSELYQKVISQRDIGKAFDYLLRQLPDLILDTPEASVILGNFMARAIADDCIPPKFIHSYKGHVDNDLAKEALKKADTLLSMKHGLVRLDNVWGVGGGIRPVKYLIKKIIALLKEYLSSGDIKEATLCLKELESPHFHHELVYEAVIMVIESMNIKTDEAICKLLTSLFQAFIITIDQMRKGFERVYDQMADLALDVPAAYAILERFVIRCRSAGIIEDELARKMPNKGRKRFVSEGDGGLLKW